jgi:MFS family permease
MPVILQGLWRQPDFARLWVGGTVSAFGSQISFLALPLTAVLVLDVSPLQMGILAAIGGLPSLAFGIGVGVWVDRLRKRPVMIAADYGRALLLISVPIAAWFQILTIEHLYVVALGTGTLGMFFGVANRSILPSLVSREQLVEANSKLAIGTSGSQVAGPGVAGVLIHLFTAPVALVVDAVTFVISALALRGIRIAESEPTTTATDANFLTQAREGLAVVSRNRILLSIAVALGGIAVFNAMFEAVWLLYVNKHLEVEPLAFGFLFAVSSVGFMVGAFVAARLIRWLGAGPAMIVAVVIAALSDLATPLAGGPLAAVVVLLTASMFLFGIGATVYGVCQGSLRQASTPLRFQGRMNGIMNTLEIGLVPLGALVGGAVAEAVGIRPTLFVAAGLELGVALWLFFSPIRSLRELPEPNESGG